MKNIRHLITLILIIIVLLSSCSDLSINTDENFDLIYQDIFDFLSDYMMELSINTISICDRQNRIIIATTRIRYRRGILNELYDNFESFNRDMIRFELSTPSVHWPPEYWTN